MNASTLRQAINEGRELVGMSINFRSTHLVEMGALAGFDCVSFDAEHGPLDMADLEAMLLAADARGLPAIARPPNGRADTILRFLDLGLRGVMVPQVESRDEAAAIVDAVRYPPEGRRGLGFVRANEWGGRSATSYVAEANESLVTIALVESRAGLDQIDEIVQVPGLDVIWVGPSDLAQSMGLLDEPDHPALRSAVERIVRAARDRGLYAGIGVGSRQALSMYRSIGVNWFLITARSLFAASAGEFLAERRAS